MTEGELRKASDKASGMPISCLWPVACKNGWNKEE
jgi:hypothetical protein